MSTGAELDAGMLVERLALKTIVEACLILEEGVCTAREIDLGMVQGAKSLPPFSAADQMGLDVLLERLERARAEWGQSFEPPVILRRLVAQGRLGPATGQGFFAYPRPDGGWERGPVKLERRGAVAIAWLDNPPANSISPDTVEALRRAWEEVQAADGVRALVFASANPQLFCAGADIKAFTRMDADAGRALVEGMHGLLREFERSRIVTLAAVNALAYGGGCELAMACDFRIGADSATFGQPEVNLGIVPGFGGTQRLPRLVGTSKALEMNLTGEPISAAEAYELGLLNALVPDHELLDTALAWARKLAGQAPLAVEQIKRISGQSDLDGGIEAEKAAFAAVFASPDAREGISAFLQRRKPRFTGA
jgi:enoyl-CoA hydratase/3-hydroxyacyl-CoA dehydrogenase